MTFELFTTLPANPTNTTKADILVVQVAVNRSIPVYLLHTIVSRTFC